MKKGEVIAIVKTKTELREWISSGFTRVEDVAYVGLGLVLAVSALVMLVIVAISLGQAIMSANLTEKIVGLLDQSLLILMMSKSSIPCKSLSASTP